jgi:hypothetical protein
MALKEVFLSLEKAAKRMGLLINEKKKKKKKKQNIWSLVTAI